MKKTLLSLVVASLSILTVQAETDLLWTTELSATGERAENAVLTGFDGIVNAPSGHYTGGWFNDWAGGEPYDLYFSEVDGSYVIGSNSAGVGDVGFSFAFGDFDESTILSGLQIGTFSWNGGEYCDYAEFEAISITVFLNGEPIYNQWSGDNPEQAIFKADNLDRGPSSTFIDISFPEVEVGPGDTLSIGIDVTGYFTGYSHIGFSYIKGIGRAE